MTSELPFLSRLRIFDEIAENAQNDIFFCDFFDKNRRFFGNFYLKFSKLISKQVKLELKWA